MAQSGDYSKIYLNRSLSTTGVKPGEYIRPDIIGVKKSGEYYLIEVASKSQVPNTAAYLRLKDNIEFYEKIPNVTIKIVDWGSY